MTESEVRIEQARVEAQVNADLCDRLEANPDFRWFQENVLSPFVEHEREKALDTEISPDARNNFAHRHALAREMVGAFKQAQKVWHNKAKVNPE